MKKGITLLVFSIFNVILINNSCFGLTLRTPSDMDVKQLNQEEKEKLQNIDYTETLEIPNQYKGKLKYTEGTEDVYFRDAKMFFGAGGRYTFADNAILVSDQDISSSYFNKKNNFRFDNNFNYFASVGIYWRNGIRLELEYSKMTLTTKNYANNFARYPDNNIIFNQYLQETGKLNTVSSILGGGSSYTTLTNNMLPKLDFEAITYMFNIIFEKSTIKSKLRPYLGFGGGLVQGDFITLKSEKPSRVLGGQIMIGLSYPISEDQVIAYIGYRGIFSKTMDQTFTRIVGVSLDNVPALISDTAFDGKTYYNPQLVKSRERFDFKTHSIDFGVKFFF